MQCFTSTDDTLEVMSELTKPRLRGYFHEIGFFASLPLLVVALWIAQQHMRDFVLEVTLLYCFSLSGMLGVSALYHRINWSESKRLLMRRLDRTMIFVLIAGSYTPFGVLCFDGLLNQVILWILWSSVVLGFLMNVFWHTAPKWLRAGLYVLTGWTGLLITPQFLTVVDPKCMLLVLTGGIVYTIGATFYAFKRPNPVQGILEYHELFHLCVLLGALCHFFAIAFYVLPMS